MLITNNYNDMGNAKKNYNPNNISKLRFGQYFLLFDIFYYLKISLIYKSVSSQNKKNFALMRF